jgi:putative colanic acid biosynthesis acetyltransferase WcaF
MSANATSPRLAVRTPLSGLRISSAGRLRRAIWNAAWLALGRFTPNPLHGWRRLVVKAFGGRIGAGAHIYPRAAIWAPWNLTIGDRSCLANGANCYNVAPVTIGEDVVVSQDAYLCTATHDYNDPAFPLRVAPIRIGSHAWVAAGAFLSPGIAVERGAVVGARAVVTESVPAWTVVAGNPARAVKIRVNFDRLES